MKFKDLIYVVDREQKTKLIVFYWSDDKSFTTYEGLFEEILIEIELKESDIFDFVVDYIYSSYGLLIIKVIEYER